MSSMVMNWLTENFCAVLADVEDGTTITIKGKVNGKDVTITYSLVKE